MLQSAVFHIPQSVYDAKPPHLKIGEDVITVRVTVDMGGIAKLLADKVAKSKAKRSRYMGKRIQVDLVARKEAVRY